MFGRPSSRQRGENGADAFSAHALEHLDALYGAALRLTRRPDEAQDLIQDTYLKAIRARQRFVEGTNIKAWLFTILHNTWRNRRRDGARSRVAFDSDAVEQASEGATNWSVQAASPEELLLRESIDADIQAALDGLPDAYREAVWLRDVEELTYQEIAEALEVPLGTVMSRLSRGRRRVSGRGFGGNR